MNIATESKADAADPAAVFAAALSLWEACQKVTASDRKINLSASYNGLDQFMRELMRVATLFEAWACDHINFDDLTEPWPYLLADHFGETCLQISSPAELAIFNDHDCLRVAIRLRLSIQLNQNLPVPVNVSAANPLFAQGSGFREFRIQTVRDYIEDDDCEVYSSEDDPFDPEFGVPYFGLYGVGQDGLLEHIGDRPTYAEAVRLAQNLAPGVEFQKAEG